MQSINDGSSNIQPTPNIINEGPLHKELLNLLPELQEKIFSYLNNGDISTLSLLTNKLNEKTIHIVKNQEFLKIASFGRSLADKLPDTYKDQKEALSHIVTSDEYKATLTFNEMKEKLDTFKKQIKEILLTIPQDELAKIFDAFKDSKPKLYFDFVALSNKHKKLYMELTMVAIHSSDTTFKEKLEEGAYAIEKTFEIAIKKNANKIVILSEFGFKPTTNNLNFAIQYFGKSIQEKSMAIRIDIHSPTRLRNQYELDRLYEDVNAMIIALLDAGAKPSKETLALAKMYNNVDMTIFEKYIK